MDHGSGRSCADHRDFARQGEAFRRAAGRDVTAAERQPAQRVQPTATLPQRGAAIDRSVIVRAGEPPDEQQLDIAEAGRAAGVADLDPGVAVVEVDQERPAEVELQPGARLVREAVGPHCGLIATADIAPPRVPPAAGLRWTRGDVGVEPVPPQARRDQGFDRTLPEGVHRIEHDGTEVEVAILDERAAVGTYVAAVEIRPRPAEIEADGEVRAHVPGGADLDSGGTVDTDLAATLEVDVLRLDEHRADAEFPIARGGFAAAVPLRCCPLRDRERSDRNQNQEQILHVHSHRILQLRSYRSVVSAFTFACVLAAPQCDLGAIAIWDGLLRRSDTERPTIIG